MFHVKRKTKTPEKKNQEKLWELCKQITRLRYGNTCYTCGKTGLFGSSWQTGHFIPNAVGGAFLRYNLRNLRPQCYHCNINLGGNGSIFYHKLVEMEGKRYVNQLFKDKLKSVKANDHYLNLIPFYEKILEGLQNHNAI